MSKVYCDNCAHLGEPHRRSCHAPGNTKTVDKWYQADVVELKRSPHKINRRNNCPWFKAREK